MTPQDDFPFRSPAMPQPGNQNSASRRIAVTAMSLVAVFAAFNLFCTKFGTYSPQNGNNYDRTIATNWGISCGQSVLLSFWLVFGTQAIVRRLFMVACLSCLLVLFTIWGSDLGLRVTAEYEVVVLAEITIVCVIARLVTGQRWGLPLDQFKSSLGTFRFSLGELGIAICCLSILLGVGRIVFERFHQELADNFSKIEDWKHGFLYGTTFSIQALSTLPLLPLVGGSSARRWMWGLVWLAAIVACATCQYWVEFKLIGNSTPSKLRDFVTIVVLNMSVLLSLVCLRIAGVRLLSTRDFSMPACVEQSASHETR